MEYKVYETQKKILEYSIEMSTPDINKQDLGRSRLEEQTYVDCVFYGFYISVEKLKLFFKTNLTTTTETTDIEHLNTSPLRDLTPLPIQMKRSVTRINVLDNEHINKKYWK